MDKWQKAYEILSKKLSKKEKVWRDFDGQKRRRIVNRGFDDSFEDVTWSFLKPTKIEVARETGLNVKHFRTLTQNGQDCIQFLVEDFIRKEEREMTFHNLAEEPKEKYEASYLESYFDEYVSAFMRLARQLPEEEAKIFRDKCLELSKFASEVVGNVKD